MASPGRGSGRPSGRGRADSMPSSPPPDDSDMEIEPVNSSFPPAAPIDPAARRFYPRRPVGPRSSRGEIINTIPSVISTSSRTGRANTVSASSRPTIRLRRLPSHTDLNGAYGRGASPALSVATATTATPQPQLTVPLQSHTRPRSVSDPARHSWLNEPNTIRASQIMSPVQEVPPDLAPPPPPKILLDNSACPPTPPPKIPLEDEQDQHLQVPQRPLSRWSSTLSLSGARSLLGLRQRAEDAGDASLPTSHRLPLRKEYNQDVVDLLDVIDPEVATLSTLTNVQNSLFVPNLGSFLNRNPTYDLSSITGRSSRRSSRIEPRRGSVIEETQPVEEPSPQYPPVTVPPQMRRQRSRAVSITSNLTDSHYAVLPHGVTLEDWTPEEKELLDDHVRHLLHSRREKFKRGWRGFKQYVSRPMGFFVTLYATLITLFGLAWVLFLIGWIYVGEQQTYAIHVIDNVLVALFAIVGDGLAPFRAIDTYHMIFIAHYHHLTWKLRKKRALPALRDRNDLPTRQFISVEADRASVLNDLEQAWIERDEAPVLTEKQQERFEHHSMKFAKSHTYYKPHETRTHFAFPVKLLIAVTILLDLHSMFQITLGAVTWGISYHVRPAALTAVILSCSISVNIAAGVVITIGDRKTRKKRIIEQEFRQGLTQEAIGHVTKKKEKIREKGKRRAEESQSSSEALEASKDSSSMSLTDDEKKTWRS
ncbi:hypothetical protein DRE_06500 [Drechslerella stenobrocha 248]|uniref:Integral membrane protein n=1 Tax=Drechslerella stenobrocha 248 TaxID=1043628 RepID=W7HX86_9PEZI|nr:hypothetical protein DRE_06500 [Drechslerella stenobrocha 248]